MSDAGKTKTVALITPLWYGHHPVYFGLFAGSFLRAGARVIGLSPNPDAAMQEIAAAVGDMHDWRDRVSLHKLPTGGRSWFNGRFEGDPYRTFQRWRCAADSLDHVEVETGWKTDLVYFSYIDSYLRFLPLALVPDITIGRPWSGLYLRNHHHRSSEAKERNTLHMLAKGDALLKNPHCPEVGVLDERFIDGMQDYLGKPVIGYPDVSNCDLPVTEYDLTSTVREKAVGRKIIGLIGLEPRKGTITMLRVALNAHKLRLPWYFVFAGTFNRDVYSESDRKFIDSILKRINSGELDNIHFNPEAGRIPTEADFNSLFSSFDVVWAAFEKFHGSSGTLSKASAFYLPCVATAGECIGHRLEHFRTGLTIPEGNKEKALEAIQHLLAGTNWEGSPLEPGYEAFNKAHSIERLDAILANLLAKF